MNLDERDDAAELSMQDQIELLVEGELTAEQRSRLLLRIDAKPQMWRSLALEFVEHQAIRESVRVACRSHVVEDNTSLESSSVDTLQVDRPPSNRDQTATRWIMSLLMSSAAVLIAFLGGMEFQLRSNGDEQRVSIGTQEIGEPVSQVSPNETNGEETPSNASDDGSKIVGHVRWLNAGSKELTPVFAGNRIDTDWLKSNPPQVDERMQRVMSRAGWEVIPKRKLVSLELPEVGHFMIPVDDVNYRFVGREVF